MTRTERARRTLLAPQLTDVTDPAQISSAWLRVALATDTEFGFAEIPDALNANPAVAPDISRRPLFELSANALPCMRWTGTPLLQWPVIAPTSHQQTWGISFWVKPDALSGVCMLFSAANNAGGTDAWRLRMYTQSTNITVEIYASGTVGRFATASLLTTAWQFVTFEYDSLAATEALRTTITINGSVRTPSFGNQGAGAATGDLVAVTGNYILAETRTGSSQYPFNGLFGPNLWIHNAKMAGATRGLFTTQGRSFLQSYEAPT